MTRVAQTATDYKRRPVLTEDERYKSVAVGKLVDKQTMTLVFECGLDQGT